MPKTIPYIPNTVSAKKFNKSQAWRKLRKKAFELYGMKCVKCGANHPEARIEADHIKPRWLYPELELDINNLQILCSKCNNIKNYNERPKYFVLDHRHFEQRAIKDSLCIIPELYFSAIRWL